MKASGLASKAVIIGAGLGGLAVAARLARMGCTVEVYETQAGPGGKAGSASWDGFRFDTGPSLLTMPEVFDELFTFCGQTRSEYLEISRLDPICHYFFPDGSQCATPGTIAGFIEHFTALGWATALELRAWFSHIEGIYRRAGTLFLEKGLDEIGTWLSPAGLRGLLGLPFLDVWRSLHQSVRAYFQDARMIQLFDRYATYNGSSPWRTPATMGIIPHVEYAFGAWAVTQGIFAIVQALHALCVKQGVQFHFGNKIRQIVHAGSTVRGVVDANNAFVTAEIVVSNGDVPSSYRMLGEPEARWGRRYRRLEPSSSGLVFYWGMKATFPQLGLHNIFFSADYEQEFHQIFDEASIPDDPTIYLNISCRITESDAPVACENWFVLVNVPPNRGQDWQCEAASLRQRVLKRIEQGIGYSVEPFIAIEKLLTPVDIEAQTACSYGSLYGLASNSWSAAFKRHPARVPGYRGLYLVGGSAHPGGGMPLVLQSAAIAGRAIAHDFRLSKASLS